MKRDFQGLTVVVTGAGSGIGLATVKKFAENGARIFGLDLIPGECQNFAHWIECDIGDDDSVKNAFQEISKSTSVIDILVNNAGIGAQGTVETVSSEEWLKVLNINIVGTSRVSSSALPYLRKSSHA